MKPHLYTRKNKTITLADGSHPEHFKSINGAKRHSRELQMKHDKGLGLGTVRKQQ